MSKDQPECLRCGRCCTELGQEDMVVRASDIKRWIDEEEVEILKKVNFCTGISDENGCCYNQVVENAEKNGLPGFLEQCKECYGAEVINTAWTSERCVFLKKVRNKDEYKCTIQHTKPDHCRKWQVGWHKNCPQKHLNPNPDPR